MSSKIPKEMKSERNVNTPSQLNVSFGYRCNDYLDGTLTPNNELGISCTTQFESSNIMSSISSFSCLSGAALSANLTLANTNLWNGLTETDIIETLDSSQSFRTKRSFPSMASLGLLSLSSHTSISRMASSTLIDIDMTETSGNSWSSMNAPFRMGSSGFLKAGDILVAGGAAGEDRVQAVYSEENGWVFCGIYDGFNGRDAADFLTAVLYEKLVHSLYQLELNVKKQNVFNGSYKRSCFINKTNSAAIKSDLSLAISASEIENKTGLPLNSLSSEDAYFTTKAFHTGLLDSLARSLAEVENEFMAIVEQTMEDRPDIVSIGSCVLVVLLHRGNLYVMNLGDSRVVLAFSDTCDSASLQAIQLTETHTVDNASELMKVLADHPDDPSVISGGRVKGKLKLTRGFGAAYLKKSHLNDALMGILQVCNLQSPPYIYTHPFSMCHRVSDNDLFVVLGSDGLFDFFKNDEVVEIVHQFIKCNPHGDPAKHLIEKLILRAADNAGFSIEELMMIPEGRRRRYHDDISVIVIILGNKQRTTKASMEL